MTSSRYVRVALRVLSALAGGVVGLLALRFVFRLVIANPANPVSSIVCAASRPFLSPWERLWPLSQVPGLAVERATLAALAVYAIVGLVLGFLGRHHGTSGAAASAGRPEETR